MDSLQQLVDSHSNATLIVDLERNIVCVNQTLVNLFAYPQDFLVGQTLEILIPERFRDGHPVFFDRYVNSPESIGSGTGLTLWGLQQSGKEFQIDTKLQLMEHLNAKYVLCEVLEIENQ